MDMFQREYDSDRVFRVLKYVASGMAGAVGFIGGLTISLLGGLIGAVLFFGLTFGVAQFIGFIVGRIFRSGGS